MKMRSLPIALATLLTLAFSPPSALAANPAPPSASPAAPASAPAKATASGPPAAAAPPNAPAAAPGAPAAKLAPAAQPNSAAAAAQPTGAGVPSADAAAGPDASTPDVEPIPTGGPAADAAPPPVTKQIVVSRSQEKLTAYENGNPVLETAVTTGGTRTPTPLGMYHVLGKRQAFMMTSPWPKDDWRYYDPSWVNYALLFEGSGYFIHDAPWRHNFGPGSNSVFGTAGGDFTGTHGCVNVPLQDEVRLFFWADAGTSVSIVP
jgi:lipoprotein-anchoring transpeptidase ErfK/SrfK